MAIHIIEDVPADEADGVVQMQLDNGAAWATKTQQSNGEFTVSADFPDRTSYAEMKAGLDE